MQEPVIADVFDSPVGTPEERASLQVWPGQWIDATGYNAWYNGGQYHTGADLNLNAPAWDSDAHAPVYAVANGTVVFAAGLPVWGNVVVVKHLLQDESCVWSRYAHLEQMMVQPGDLVERGQQIGAIGNANGRYPFHLHFDIARIDLGARPGDWPGVNPGRVLRDYVDPLKFILGHRPSQ